MAFPLADWIDLHSGLPHSLGTSGMFGSLTSMRRLLRSAERPPADPAALRRTVADRLGVDAPRVFLTHGASEANGLAMFYLGISLRKEGGSTPRVHVHYPEYPPLSEVARLAGFRPAESHTPDLWVRSEPNNPTGHRSTPAERAEMSRGARNWLLDETFREFSGLRSVAAEGAPGVWATGTLTKAFGADPIRVGWVVPPEDQAEEFGRFHGVVTDGIPDESVRLAAGVLERADDILGETRRIFDANWRSLERVLPGLGPLRAPLAFDRPGPEDTDAFAQTCVDQGVLVCPGSFFGDPRGVRLGLTRRNFSESLRAYVQSRRGLSSA